MCFSAGATFVATDVIATIGVATLRCVMMVKGYAFSSVWCPYAAVLSIVIYWNFSSRPMNIDKPDSSFRPEIASEPAALRHALSGSLPSRSLLR